MVYFELPISASVAFDRFFMFLRGSVKHQALHEKPYFLFLNVLKRWSFQKNRAGIWSFLYYPER